MPNEPERQHSTDSTDCELLLLQSFPHFVFFTSPLSLYLPNANWCKLSWKLDTAFTEPGLVSFFPSFVLQISGVDDVVVVGWSICAWIFSQNCRTCEVPFLFSVQLRIYANWGGKISNHYKTGRNEACAAALRPMGKLGGVSSNQTNSETYWAIEVHEIRMNANEAFVWLLVPPTNQPTIENPLVLLI